MFEIIEYIYIMFFGVLSIEPPALGIIFKANNPEISSNPVRFTKVCRITGKGLEDVFFWYPIAPPGYASLGCVVSRKEEPPPAELFCCPRLDLVNPANILESPISKSANSKSSHCWSIWKVENQVKVLSILFNVIGSRIFHVW